MSEVYLSETTLIIPAGTKFERWVPGIWYPRKPWDRVEHFAIYYRLERWGA